MRCPVVSRTSTSSFSGGCPVCSRSCLPGRAASMARNPRSVPTMLRSIPGQPEARKLMPAPELSRFRKNDEPNLDAISQLALTHAQRLIRARLDDLPVAMQATLAQLSAALSADSCQLVELAEGGEVTCVHTPSRPGGWAVTSP